MEPRNNIEPSNEYYNPYGEDVKGCLVCILFALSDLNYEARYIADHPTDDEIRERMLLRIAQLNAVVEHALHIEFFFED